MMHVTYPGNLGEGLDIELEDDEDPGLAILGVADNVRRRREELGYSDPLSPVTVRVWEVTEDGFYKLSTMQEHQITPQPADIPDWQ